MIRQALTQIHPEFKIDALKNTLVLVAPFSVLAFVLYPPLAPLYTAVCLMAGTRTWQRDAANRCSFVLPALKDCDNVDDMVEIIQKSKGLTLLTHSGWVS